MLSRNAPRLPLIPCRARADATCAAGTGARKFRPAKRARRSRGHVGLTVAWVLTVGGCASPAVRSGVPAPASPAALEIVATDLVAVLAQVPELSPRTTTIQVSDPASGFGVAVEQALRRARYGLQRVSADQGSHYLRHTAVRSTTQAGTRHEFEIRVAAVELRRHYLVRNGRVVPASPMRVRSAGAFDAAALDAMFSNADERFTGGIEQRDERGATARANVRVVEPDGDAPAPPAPADLLDRIREAIGRASTDGRETPRGARLDGHVPLRRVTLRFAPDSLVLGARGRGGLDAVARGYQRISDRLVVRACPATAALGEDRDARVVARLSRAGVPRAAVFGGGCPSSGLGPDALSVTLERAWIGPTS